MDVQKFADTPIEPRLAQWMHPSSLTMRLSSLSARRPSRTFVKDRQISPPLAHNNGDFNYHDSAICEYCPRDGIRNYFEDDTTAAPEVNTLSSSTVDTSGGAILRFPSDALQLTWETNRLPEADPQSPPHQPIPLSKIRDECAVNVEEDDGTLFEPSYAPVTGQILPATTLAITSQDAVASGACKEPRRSSRNSKSAIAHTQTNLNRTKRLNRSHCNRSISIQRPCTRRRVRSTEPPSHSTNQTTFSYTNSDTPKGSYRASHSLIEKQYRTRLNRQFGALLSAIPNDLIAADVNGVPGKAVSKGAVLFLAKRYIEALEKSKMNLEGDKEMLIGEIRRLQRELARLEG
ncbi:hypothetical protein B0J14DRAFT_602074 [Halenospora varia]|nr:hypothetical protein B0J14DRAFT_602074 [Halenospora varia]